MTRNQILELFPIGSPDGLDILRKRGIGDPISAVTQGVGSIIGGVLGANASKKAAELQAASAAKVAGMATQSSKDAQAGVTEAVSSGKSDITGGVNDANKTLADVYNTQTSNLNPYLQTGSTGLQMLNAATAPGGDLTKTFAFNPEDINKDQGYQFLLQQGQKALQEAAAAKGQALGGGTLKALDQYTQGMASTEYGKAYDRALTTFSTNRANQVQNLGLMTGQGQFGTAQFNQAAENTGNRQAANTVEGGFGTANLGEQGAVTKGGFNLEGTQIAGSALTGGTQAQAAGTIGAANSYNNMLGGLSNAATTFSLGKMLKPPAGSSPPITPGGDPGDIARTAFGL